MTSSVDSYPAGPALDTLVAEKVMGLRVFRDPSGCGWTWEGRPFEVGRRPYEPVPIPRYSTSDAALEILPSLIKKYEVIHIGCGADGFALTYPKQIEHTTIDEDVLLSEAPTLALAICRAALKAVL